MRIQDQARQRMQTGLTRAPFARMCFIARLIIRRRPFNMASVASELEVNRKTVQRDLDFLRDRLGYEIEYSPSDFSYFGRPPRERIL